MRVSTAVRALALGVATSLMSCALPHGMAPIPSCGAGAATQVEWWGPSDPDDRAANEARCRTVGDPVVVASPGPGFPAPAPGDSLAVFNWNVAVGAADLLSFLEDEVGLSCAGLGSRPGPRFRHVVLLLQEAHRQSDDLPAMTDPDLAGRPSSYSGTAAGGPDVLEMAAHCGLAAAYLPSGRDGADRADRPRTDKGNAILSTLPLEWLAAMESPYETERKVALAADLRLPEGGRLRVVAAHLDVTGSFRRTLLSGNQTRARQARGLLEALDSLERSQGASPPTLVGGDFNAWSGFETALRLFRTALPDSPRWEGKATRGPFPTDHIFFRRGEGPAPGVVLVEESYRRLELRYGSDHEPLFVWLSVEDQSASN